MRSRNDGENPVRTILILAANPKGTIHLRLDEEVREINNGLERGQRREQFNLVQRRAVRVRDVQRAILDVRPQIVHFSGHGVGEEGLAFEDETGRVKFVDAEALAGLFLLFAEQVECVVLNACYSEVQAEAIVRHINYVVGMRQAIGDEAAIEFAVSFYDALVAGRPVEFAHKFGCAAIRMAGISEHLTPVLKKKPDTGETTSTLSLPEDQPSLDKAPTVHTVERRAITNIVAPKNWYPHQQLPEEFEALIEEKSRSFCGRKFVFDAFEQFLDKQPKGYFTVVAEPGMGKSALAAKYILKHHTVCYFNLRAERRNRPELFLESIREQLIHRYQLQGAEKANLATLLEKASQKLLPSERLVIVVDALDEVEQEPGGNLLHLPMTLPNRVYFLLTRRSCNLPLIVSPGTPVRELDLTAQEYKGFNQADVKAYIHLMLHEDLTHQVALQKWVEARHLREEEFVEQLAAKSENNFMYLRYILPAIAEGVYDDLTLKQLPQGLKKYYQIHWLRMGMDEATQERIVVVLFILVEVGTPIPWETIAAIAGEEEFEVQRILEKWREYLRQQKIEEQICYSLYHASFLDFLKEKWELKPTRRLFQYVNQRIVDYLEREMN